MAILEVRRFDEPDELNRLPRLTEQSSASQATSAALTVHAATRIAGLAQPGEVLVSAPAMALLEGSGLHLEDAGEHQLKSLPRRRRRRAYRLIEEIASG